MPVSFTPRKNAQKCIFSLRRCILVLGLGVFLATSRIQLCFGGNGSTEKVLKDQELSTGSGDGTN